MTFRRFVAATTRDCLRLMRETLGPDALIVSTRRTSGGVEVVGTRGEPLPDDLDAMPDDAGSAPPPPPPRMVRTQPSRQSSPQRIVNAAISKPVPPRPAAPAPASPANLWDRMEDEPVRLSAAARVLSQQEHDDASSPGAGELPLASWPRVPERQISHLVRAGKPEQAAAAPAAPAPDTPRLRAGAAPAQPSESERRMRESMDAMEKNRAEPPTVEVPAKTLRGMFDDEERVAFATEVSEPIMSEMRSMRGWLERQMDVLAWKDTTQRNPQRRIVWSRMVDAGFTPELARTVASHLPEHLTAEQAEQWLASVLVRNLRCADPTDNMVTKGGRYAIVGPTGVGKTTTTAKIAAHCVVKYGAASLGLVTTDQHRIGAVDQLATFGQILGVQVYAARGAQDLEAILATMGDRHLVLVDTAGMSQRDDGMADHLRALSVSNVKRVLVMPGGTHAEQAEDIMQAYSAGGLGGLIVSKLDETVRLGGVLDAGIRYRIPLNFVTNGQRVPDDLHAANGQLLVHRALRHRSSPVFALDANELDWACMPSNYGQSGAVPASA